MLAIHEITTHEAMIRNSSDDEGRNVVRALRKGGVFRVAASRDGVDSLKGTLKLERPARAGGNQTGIE